eukprot:2891196-Pleurochrysis_carterae.AAC.1
MSPPAQAIPSNDGQKGSSVPVPRLLGLCEDEAILGVPFYLMEYVPGRARASHKKDAMYPSTMRRSAPPSRKHAETLPQVDFSEQRMPAIAHRRQWAAEVFSRSSDAQSAQWAEKIGSSTTLPAPLVWRHLSSRSHSPSRHAHTHL